MKPGVGFADLSLEAGAMPALWMRRCLGVSWKGMAQMRHPLFFRLLPKFPDLFFPSRRQKARRVSGKGTAGLQLGWVGPKGDLEPGVRLRSARKDDFPSVLRANARGIDPRFRTRLKAPSGPKLEEAFENVLQGAPPRRNAPDIHSQ